MRYTVGRVSIDILPEDVLLEIFDHHVDPTQNIGIESWCTLVHVCRKWRNIVLESPLRLNLRIHCHPATPVREKLDVWPALPIVLEQYGVWEPKWMDNVIAALEHNNRILSDRLSACSKFANGKSPGSHAQIIPPGNCAAYRACFTGAHWRKGG